MSLYVIVHVIQQAMFAQAGGPCPSPTTAAMDVMYAMFMVASTQAIQFKMTLMLDDRLTEPLQKSMQAVDLQTLKV